MYSVSSFALFCADFRGSPWNLGGGGRSYGFELKNLRSEVWKVNTCKELAEQKVQILAIDCCFFCYQSEKRLEHFDAEKNYRSSIVGIVAVRI